MMADGLMVLSLLWIWVLLGGQPQLLLASPLDNCEGPSFGINYGMVANNLPSPAKVVTLLQAICVSKAKIFDANPSVLRTFTNTGISFIIGIPNEEMGTLGDPTLAFQWVEDNVATHLPETDISAIMVGNEIFSTNNSTLMSQVIPAMQNIYVSLALLDLHHQIIVSTTHSFSTITTSYPPSSGKFDPAIAETFMKPLLDFLSKTRAPFFINVYPFFPYKANPKIIPLEYALFEPNPGVQDPVTKLHYDNMFDAQIDAVYFAMEALGYHNVSLLVSETGWPSAGDQDEAGATIKNARTYHENLVKHLTYHSGTPFKPNNSLEVYLFALFNEDMKPGPSSERNFGLFKPDGSMVFDFHFLTETFASSSPSLSCPSSSSHLLLLMSLFLIFLSYLC